MRALLAVSLALISAISSARAADELLPPFGFRWNDSMSRVEAVLRGAKAQIVSREKKEGREVWTVEGLVHPGLKRTLFTFKGESLFGVELQYEYPDWTIERYNQRMGEIRKYFDAKVRNRQTSLAFARHGHGCHPNAGRLPVDGRGDHA